MNNETHEKVIPLAIDVEQWRRDIQTFADTTGQALEAIIAELSASCSSSATGATLGQSGDANWERTLAFMTDSSTQDCRRDERLANLKSKIANRISQSN